MAEWDEEVLSDDGLDASSLAGMSEYSATGGGSQPLHSPQLRRPVDENDVELPDAGSLREMYRYSLSRMTEDASMSVARGERFDDGPLHVDDSERE
jgi:hypothetical protein